MKHRGVLFLFAIFSLGSFSQGDAAEDAISLVSVLRDKAALQRPHDIELQGDYAFIPGKGGTLAVIDISSVKNPKIVWSNEGKMTLNDAQTVLPTGRHLFVGARDFYSYDIEKPGEPVHLKTLSDRPRIDRINGMIRRGGFLISANKTGWITVFDIRDPSNPKLAGALDTRKHGNVQSPHDIVSFDDHVAIVDQSGGAPVKVRLYRVADPDTHKLLPCEKWQVAGAVRRDDLNGANRVGVSGPHLFVACSQGENFKIGFLDIRNPDHPRHLATMPFTDVHSTGLTIAGRVLFVGGGRAVQAIDITNPADPESLAVFHSSKVFPAGKDSVHDLVYRDGFLYVTGQNDHCLAILRVNDPKIRKLASSKPDGQTPAESIEAR